MALSIFSLQSLRISLPKWNQTVSLYSRRGMSIPSKNDKIYDELGLPRPPKRPLTPYLRFTVEANKELEPGRYSSVSDRAAVVAKKWRTLPNNEKDKYFKEYEAAREKYAIDLQEYKDRFGEEQLSQIKFLKQQRRSLEKLENESRKEKVLKKKTKQTLGRPKIPLNGFLVFMGENAEKYRKSEPGFFARVGKAWQDLDEAEQLEYKQKADAGMDEYKLQLVQWEQKMVDIGRLDLVRKSSLPQLTGIRAKASHLAEAKE